VTLKKQMLALAALFLLLPLSMLYLFGRLEQALQLASAQALQEWSDRMTADIKSTLIPILEAPAFNPVWVDTPPLLDGYADEWQSYSESSHLKLVWGDGPTATAEATGSIASQAVQTDNTLYFNFNIPNPKPREWQPGHTAEAFDQIRLYSAVTEVSDAGPTRPHPLIIGAQSEGPATSYYEGHAVLDSAWRQDRGRLQIELALPSPATLGHFTLCWHSGHWPPSAETCLLDAEGSRLNLNPLTDTVEERLKGLTPPQTRLTLTDRTGLRRFAHDNDLARDQPDEVALLHLIAGRIATLLSSPPALQDIVWQHREDIRQTSLLHTRALYGSDGQLLGHLSLERRLSSLRSQTSEALSDSLGLALLLMGLTLSVLLFYGFWLSRRIQVLRDGVRLSLDSESRYQMPFVPSHQSDEIGELSRTFARLLDDLRAYASHKEAFVSRLTHECRTPVSIISSSMQLASLSDDETEREAYRQRAEQACQRLSQLMLAMGEAARLESLMQRFEKTTLDLAALLDTVAPHYRTLLEAHTLDCQLFSAPVMLNGVADLLVQALDKLIENARDFTPPGKMITLTLRTQGKHALLRVENEGSALPDDMLDRLFQPYQTRRNATLSPSGDSLHLGLGLTIVQLIVRFHGGQASAHNTERGVAIDLMLPLPDN
jgi:two-component system sensor histidine kinase ChvG